MDKSDQKKELIRAAAITVLSKQGFYNTKASQIAEEAGIAVGTIYNYFANKEAILDYIFEVELQKRLTMLKEVAKEENDLWSKMAFFFHQHFQEIKKNPAVGEILVREKEFPKKNGSISITNYLTKIPLLLEKLILKAQEEGEVKADINPTLASSFIFGAIQGIVEKAINDDPQLLNEAADQLLTLMKEGLGKDSS